MIIESILADLAITAVISLVIGAIGKLINLWRYRSRTMPENDKAEMSDTDKEKIQQTQALIHEVFGPDPVERLRSSSNKERIDLMDNFANRLSELYGLDIQVDVTVDQVDHWGGYNWSDNKAVFNIALLMVDGQNEHFDYCAWETIDTVVHELRHAVQYRTITEPGFWNVSEERRTAWANNMRQGGYISSATDMRAYASQPVERDAFTFAAEVIEGVKKQ